MTLRRDLEAAADLATCLATTVALRDDDGCTVLDRIRDAMAGHPRATRYDRAGGRSARAWCWRHERDLTRCHRDGLDCRGETIDVSDPTGEAAIGGDPASADLRQLHHLAARLRRDTEAMAYIVNRYQRRNPRPDEVASTLDWNAPHCESCCRIEVAKGVPWWVEPLTQERTTVAGRLTTAQWLCRWCYEHVVDRSCLPNDDELEQRRSGKRVRCPHPVVDQVA